jgi:hypothetical protein
MEKLVLEHKKETKRLPLLALLKEIWLQKITHFFGSEEDKAHWVVTKENLSEFLECVGVQFLFHSDDLTIGHTGEVEAMIQSKGVEDAKKTKSVEYLQFIDLLCDYLIKDKKFDIREVYSLQYTIPADRIKAILGILKHDNQE